jgi:hypothetical protein
VIPRSTSSQRRRTITLFATHINIAYRRSSHHYRYRLHQQQSNRTHHRPNRKPTSTKQSHDLAIPPKPITMLSTATTLPIPILCLILALLYQKRRIILWTTLSTTLTTLLVKIKAEPWAYLLFIAALFLYATITAFHRKYHKVSPRASRGSSGSGSGSNRRARRKGR